MKGLFLQILNMSASAIWLILAVLLIRFAMQKLNAPKNLRYILWAFVAIRLICPFSIESAMSLLPRQELLPAELQVSKEDQVDSLIEFKEEEKIEYEYINGIDNIVLKPNDEDISAGEGFLPDPESTVGYNNINDTPTSDDSLNWTSILSWIWTVGVVGLFLYGIISYVNLYKKVQASMSTEDNVWMCDAISGPFLLGIFNPRIYMPSDIKEEQIPYIIAHEKEHIRCLDYVWKPLGFVILTLHWFNPFAWLAYVLMCKDIEYACDERVIRSMDNQEKKAYMESLLSFSSPRHYISACPVAFSETSIKERIKNVVDYKKPAVWIVGLGVIACIIVAICFMTTPPGETKNPNGLAGDKTPDGEGFQSGVPGSEENDDTIYLPYVENKVLYETTADLNHDGIEDKVQTVLIYHPSEGADDTVNHQKNSVVVEVFRGIEEGVYETEVSYMTWSISISTSPISRDAYVLTEKDGKDYLVYTNRNQTTPETLICSYEVMHLGESNFVTDSSMSMNLTYDATTEKWETDETENSFAVFEEGYTSWFENGVVLITFESMNSGYYSEEGNIIEAASYYDTIWPVDDSLLEDLYSRDELVILNWDNNNRIHNASSLSLLIQTVGMDTLYADYDGEDICHIFVDNSVGVMTRDDVIFYRTQETDVQKVLKKMVSIMIEPLMEPSENRTYTITDYRVDDMELVEGDENIWFIPYIQGAYKYEGTDLITFEEQLAYSEVDEDGLIPFFGQGSDGQFYYILIKNGDVYRLERGGLFETKYNYIFESYIEGIR